MAFEFFEDSPLDLVYLKSIISNDRDIWEHLKNLAQNVARIDRRFEPTPELSQTAERFYYLMFNNYFLPDIDILKADLKQKIPVLNGMALRPSDDFEDVFLTLKNTSLYLQHDLKVAIDFSDLRASRSQYGLGTRQSLGPVKFIELFERAPQQGYDRKNLRFYLNIDHLDINDFIAYMAQAPEKIQFALGINNEFIRALESEKKYGLRHQKNQEPCKWVLAEEVFYKIIEVINSGKKVDFLFQDNIDELKTRHRLTFDVVTNFQNQLVAAGELMCCGTINLGSFVSHGELDEKRLAQTIYDAIHFMDNCIEGNFYPDTMTGNQTKRMRRLGLSVLGVADVLTALCPDMGEKKMVRCLQLIISFIQKHAILASFKLGEKRGMNHQVHFDGNWYKTRHCQLLSQIHMPELSQISRSPQYLFSKNPLLDDWQEILKWHRLWQQHINNLASLKFPFFNIKSGAIRTDFIKAHHYDCLSFELTERTRKKVSAKIA